jgi:hypothetical protein
MDNLVPLLACQPFDCTLMPHTIQRERKPFPLTGIFEALNDGRGNQETGVNFVIYSKALLTFETDGQTTDFLYFLKM